MEWQTMRVMERTELMSALLRQVVLWSVLSILLLGGCAPVEPVSSSPAETSPGRERRVVTPAPGMLPSGFAATQVEVLPLTELVDGPQGTRLNIYVSLLDAYNEKIKAPGTLRFELYEYVQRSSEPKGQRIAVWPDIDLNSPAENQKYWRDFLRAYEFTLAAQASKNKTYILEVTCLCPSGKRLSTEWAVKPEN